MLLNMCNYSFYTGTLLYSVITLSLSPSFACLSLLEPQFVPLAALDDKKMHTSTAFCKLVHFSASDSLSVSTFDSIRFTTNGREY